MKRSTQLLFDKNVVNLFELMGEEMTIEECKEMLLSIPQIKENLERMDKEVEMSSEVKEILEG
jgi:hypothetical protein